mmetsp:Transcript_24702/g.41241  ORF Transcript_24702/g.41241 Transcript_24702/m.41241 type:complete len:419 (+) Transcript_24702:124-1380(+)
MDKLIDRYALGMIHPLQSVHNVTSESSNVATLCYFVARNVTISSGTVALGYFLIPMVPVSYVGPGTNFLAAVLATYAGSPFMRVKLASQIQPRSVGVHDNNDSESRESAVTCGARRFLQYIGNELSIFAKCFSSIITTPNAFKGGGWYAARGGVAKMLMFLGYDSLKPEFESLVSSSTSEQTSAIPTTTPVFVSLPVGLCSGILQGTVVSVLEWRSSLISRHATYTSTPTTSTRSRNSNTSSTSPIEQPSPPQQPQAHPVDITEAMKSYVWKTDPQSGGSFSSQLRRGGHLPITSTAARNCIFDSVFYSLTDTAAGLSYGPAAAISMTFSYIAEKVRSESQQGKPMEIIRAEFSQQPFEHNFNGWFAKAVEFVFVFAVLQLLKNRVQQNERSETKELAAAAAEDDNSENGQLDSSLQR